MYNPKEPDINIQDIWLAKVRFEEKNQYKIRPVIVMDTDKENAEILFFTLKVTSQEARNSSGRKEPIGLMNEFEIPLLEWRDENLSTCAVKPVIYYWGYKAQL